MATHRRRPVYIYCLVDPRDESVRYVGCSVCPKERLKQHYANTTSNKAMRPWIAELRSLNVKPMLVLLEECWSGKEDEQEEKWYQRFKQVGEPLLQPSPAWPLWTPAHAGVQY